MIYFRIGKNDGKIIAENMRLFLRVDEFENRKNFSEVKNGKGLRGAFEIKGDVGVWVVVENESDLLKSSKLFKKTFDIYRSIAANIWENQQRQVKAYMHILSTIQGQMRQKIEVFASDQLFYGEKYADSVDNISNIVEGNKESAADLICYMHQRVADMRAHLLGAEVIHVGEEYQVKQARVSLKRAILNQSTPFLKDLEKMGIRIRFYFGEENEVEVDKNMFSLVMYNFFSNAVKYAKRDSEIRLHYSETQESLDVSMISLKMERGEIASLFNETARGIHATSIPGSGIGLFVLQKALGLMGKEPMFIDPDYTVNILEGGMVYNENHFKFLL